MRTERTMVAEIKRRLFITAVVVAMLALYIGPFIVLSRWSDILNTILLDCKEDFSFCWRKANKDASLPFLVYLSPFLPAIGVIWIFWLFSLEIRIGEERVPRKTIMTLIFLGMIVAIAAIIFTLNEIISQPVDKLYEISTRTFWIGPYVAFGWLAAPILFQRMLAPLMITATTRAGVFLMCALALTPAMAFAVQVFREATTDSVEIERAIQGRKSQIPLGPSIEEYLRQQEESKRGR
jgi:hypothetical protein